MGGRSINEARSHNATRRAFGYQTEDALTDPPAALGWSRAEWDSLSPGFKREIERDLRRRGEIEDLCSPRPAPASLRERKAAIEYAGRKRL